MKIEDEIPQAVFRNDNQKTIVNITFTQAWLDAQAKKFFKKFDITPQQYSIMKLIKERHPDPCTINYLKDRMIDKMSDASRIVERLRVKKLIERKVRTDDRRSVDIIITSKGQGLLFSIESEIHHFENLMIKLTSEEIASLNRLLDKLRG